LPWGVPISLVGLLLKGGLHSGQQQAALFSLMLVSSGLLLTQRAPLFQRSLPLQSQQLGAVVGNTAYFGLPVALALLPPEALSFSITYDFVGTLVTWGLGPLLLDGQRPKPRLVSNTPVVGAVLVAVPLMASPWHAALAAALWWPARLVLWLMLLQVGMRLARLLDQRLEADGLVLQAAAPAAMSVLLLAEASRCFSPP
jgi:predicted permease